MSAPPPPPASQHPNANPKSGVSSTKPAAAPASGQRPPAGATASRPSSASSTAGAAGTTTPSTAAGTRPAAAAGTTTPSTAAGTRPAAAAGTITPPTAGAAVRPSSSSIKNVAVPPNGTNQQPAGATQGASSESTSAAPRVTPPSLASSSEQQQHAQTSAAVASFVENTGSGVDAAGPLRKLYLLVYVDKEATPHKVIATVNSVAALLDHLSTVLPRQPRKLSYWDADFNQYVPMRSVEVFEATNWRGRVLVETGGVSLTPLSKNADVLEYTTLRDQVERLSPPGGDAARRYTVSDIVRVSNAELEDCFNSQKGKLLDPAARTLMLLYTGNAGPAEDAVHVGFTLPRAVPGASSGMPGRASQLVDQGIVFANDIVNPPRTTGGSGVGGAAEDGSVGSVVRFLFCEVAVGRAMTVFDDEIHGATVNHGNQFGDTTSGRFQNALRGASGGRDASPYGRLTLNGNRSGGSVADFGQYDSLLSVTPRSMGTTRLEEFIVYHPHQALPRYVVTCKVESNDSWSGEHGGADGRVVAALGCGVHHGEGLKVWCATCRSLICPYCMNGAHKSHEMREVNEVAVLEKDAIQRMAHTLEATLDRLQQQLTKVAQIRGLINEHVSKGEDRVRLVVKELIAQLHRKEDELTAQLKHARVDRLAFVDNPASDIQDAIAALGAKLADMNKLLAMPVETSQLARLQFLADLTRVHALMKTPPRYDDTFAELVQQIDRALSTNGASAGAGPGSINSGAPTVPGGGTSYDVDFMATQRAVEQLRLLEVDEQFGTVLSGQSSVPRSTIMVPKSGGHSSSSPHQVTTPGPSSPVRASPAHTQMSEEMKMVSDLETGYIWVIPNASSHFALNQTRDIFSDPFTLLGQQWELKLTSQPRADYISVFLHAVRHSHRMDFRVVLFCTRGWYVKTGKNWSDAYKGRGWGIKPFLDKQSLLKTYVNDDVLKMCVVPTSALY